MSSPFQARFQNSNNHHLSSIAQSSSLCMSNISSCPLTSFFSGQSTFPYTSMPKVCNLSSSHKESNVSQPCKTSYKLMLHNTLYTFWKADRMLMVFELRNNHNLLFNYSFHNFIMNFTFICHYCSQTLIF
jgi:hypothetical protein